MAQALSKSCSERSMYGLLRTPQGSGLVTRFVILLINIALTPIILIARFLTAYVIPFLMDTGISFYFYCFSMYCCPNLYTDPVFGPNETSLGAVKSKKKGDIIWLRLADLNTGSKDETRRMQLFSTAVEDDNVERGICCTILHQCFLRSKMLTLNAISAEDISQGALGDCWLLSSLAALAHQPSYIRKLFLTPSYNPGGRYRVQIHDPISKKDVVIVIDDYIPCHKANKKPVFTAPQGKEAWVMLIEKVFAKYQRSYANIEGNAMLYALTVLTGCNGNHFMKSSEGWKTWSLHVERPTDPKDRDHVMFKSRDTTKRSNDEMFSLLMRLVNKNCIVTAGTKGRDKKLRESQHKKSGIVPGHAYTILRVAQPILTRETLKLVQLRNPWGTFEWDGDWSDKSEQWKQYPGVKTELWPNLTDNDGCFWMSWDDFLKYYNQIDAIYTGGDGLDLVSIDIKEDFHVLGPCLGFVFGTVKYWACCFGAYKLWCAPQERKGRKLEDIESLDVVEETLGCCCACKCKTRK